MEATIFGHAIVGAPTTRESLELNSREGRLTLSCAPESKENYPLKTSRTIRSISKAMPHKKLKQSHAADLNYTAADLNREFPNDDACLEYIKEQRWPNGVTKCAKCNLERKHSRVTGRTAYACNRCGNVAREARVMHPYPSRDIYHTVHIVLIVRSAPLRSGDDFLSFIFSLCLRICRDGRAGGG
jgi:hypothetical protein